MSTVTSIAATDLISASRTVINTNFGNLNTDKVESSLITGGYSTTSTISGSFVAKPIVASILGSGAANTATFLRGDLTWAAANLVVKQSTDYAATGRIDSAVFGSGAVTYGTTGASLDTSATTTSAARVIWDNTNSAIAIFNQSPFCSCVFELNTKGTTGQFYTGLGFPTVAGAGLTYTVAHIGFKVVISGSVASLYATQADGITENASSALTTLSAGDIVEVCWKVNGSSSVDYYWRVNGGALSSATNLTSNMPTVSSAAAHFSSSVSNVSTATRNIFNIWFSSYER